MSVYKTISGQSIYDILLMTYGTFDYLSKLVFDNMENIDSTISIGQEFTWDETLAANQTVNQTLINNNLTITTL